LIGEVAACLGEGHHALTQLLELQDGKLPTKRLADDFAAALPGAFRDLIEPALQVGVETNCDCGFHGTLLYDNVIQRVPLRSMKGKGGRALNSEAGWPSSGFPPGWRA